MGSLFDTDVPPVTLASPETVRALVDGFGFHPDKVRLWSHARAESTLASCRKRASQDKNHGAAAALHQEPEAEPDRVHVPTRVLAATYLGEAIEEGHDDLLWCIYYAVVQLTRDEAATFARLLKTELQLHPVTREPLTLPESPDASA